MLKAIAPMLVFPLSIYLGYLLSIYIYMDICSFKPQMDLQFPAKQPLDSKVSWVTPYESSLVTSTCIFL